MSKISVVTLGCPKNLVDSDALISDLKAEGFEHTPDVGGADIVLVNTCGFIEDAKKESIEEILRLKQSGDGSKKLVVFGCMAKRYREELAEEMPEIDAIWGVGEHDKIVEYCKAALSGQRSAVSGQTKNRTNRLTTGDTGFQDKTYAYLKIAEGCDRGCTFCVIPSIRGRYRSAEPERILKTAEAHVKTGAGELIIVAQDIGNYNFSGYSLASLLKDIASISGDFRIRLLYLYPSTINDRLLEAISDEDKVCKYLDIPFQHSEDRILKAMGRGGKKQNYIDEIKEIREAMPEAALRTTFIVGFPGETEDDFAGLKDFVQSVRFDRLGVFEYSREEGTPAAVMKGHVSKKEKERRRHEIMEMQSRISLEKNKALIGRKFRALVDEVDGEVAIARIYSQAPEIDGVVFIENGHGTAGKGIDGRHSAVGSCASRITRHASRPVRVGNFVNIEITEAFDYDLKGVVVP